MHELLSWGNRALLALYAVTAAGGPTSEVDIVGLHSAPKVVSGCQIWLASTCTLRFRLGTSHVLSFVTLMKVEAAHQTLHDMTSRIMG